MVIECVKNLKLWLGHAYKILNYIYIYIMGGAKHDKMGWDKQNSFLTCHLFRSQGSKSIRGRVKQDGSNRIGQFTKIPFLHTNLISAKAVVTE